MLADHGRAPDLAALIDTVWSRCFQEVAPDVVESTGLANLSPDTHAISYTDNVSSPSISSIAGVEDSDEKNAAKLHGALVVLVVAQRGWLRETSGESCSRIDIEVYV